MTTSAAAMVGRDADLARLNERLDEVRAGAPFTVVIGGEAGIGKTRLVREFQLGLPSDVRLLAGQCVDLGSVAAPYAPVKAALRTLIADIGPERVLEAAGPGSPALAALLPELVASDPEAAAVAAPAGVGAATGQLHEGIAVLLETVSRERPVVLLIEDLHWVDTATLALLRFLMRALGSSRVLTVLTYRSEDVTRGHPLRAFLSEAERDRWVERRDLSRLSRAQVRKLTKSLVGEPPTDSVIDTVFRRSDGVPFFVEELVGLDGCRDEGELPDTLRELLLARYERLSDPAQALLRVISVGGVRISHTLLETVFDGTADELDLAARESVLAGVLTIDGDDYAFRHALVREAILADLLPGERARFHSRYAEAYETAAAAGTRRLAAEISFHWLGAHDAARAFPATIHAMREARAAAAYSTAAQLGERAIGLWDVVPEPEQASGMTKLELMGRTASHLRNAGEGERSLALVKAALAECPRDDPQYPRFLRDKATDLASVGRPGSIPVLEEALEVLGERPSELRMTVLIVLSGRFMIEGRLDEAVDTAERALEVALEVESPRYASIAANVAAVSRASRGEVEAGFAGLERARELAHGDGAATLRYWVNASDLHFLVGNYAEAVRLAEEGLEQARAQGVERSSGLILASNAVDPLFALGEWDRAAALIERALALDPPGPFGVYLQRARIWSILWLGEPVRAAEQLRRVRSTMTEIMEVEEQTRLSVSRVAAEVALAAGDIAGAWRDAKRVLDEPEAPLPGYGLPLVWVAARVVGAARAGAVERAGGIPDALAAEIGAAEPALREVLAGMRSWPTQPLWAAFFEAELAEAPEGAPGSDAAAWQAAAKAAAAPTAPGYLAPYALTRQGEAELAGGDRAAAKVTLQSAFDLALSGGVGAVRDRVEQVAAAAGLALDGGMGSGRPKAGAGPGIAGPAASDVDAIAELTARERQVLELIAEGLSNRQIGERLFISGKTASVHVSAILRKLGAATRTEAAYRAGVLR
ncbi:DNA-binding CsgD family transcriptional regulator/tetratricopeptide (TPR) repeat protein [Agromyces cerinus]|uniref:helix-turn-helix transcriptional regulator n=1 Tax=Agromyces cerinus TaxID=33878 RepID=UPI0027DE5A0A|nr:AAA family ATPase [Agromyces cerinus]MBM7832335.1 DNA-binding CsgD family transcriptional regulator/tetratricopeptide (TPR) repeat protein [Agromyces cerinus]